VEIDALVSAYSQFLELNTEVWAISTDSVYCHKAWVEKSFNGSLRFPLVSDRNHTWSEMFNCLNTDGTSHRCTIIVDKENRIRYYALHDVGVARNIDEILHILSNLIGVV